VRKWVLRILTQFCFGNGKAWGYRITGLSSKWEMAAITKHVGGLHSNKAYFALATVFGRWLVSRGLVSVREEGTLSKSRPHIAKARYQRATLDASTVTCSA